jgi:hypothetical protein
MHHVLNIDSGLIAIYFVAITLTAPVTGVIIGGILTNSLGGYENIKG